VRIHCPAGCKIMEEYPVFGKGPFAVIFMNNILGLIIYL
jgi:hypothetical protein